MTIKNYGGVFGRNPTFNNVTVENDLNVSGQLIINGNVITGLDLEGSWNATTNVPSLTTITPSAGQFWTVSTGGSTNLGGITNWTQGDWAVYDGTSWQRIEGGQVDLNTGVSGVLPIANGGTGQTTASGIKQALDLEVGIDLQAYDAGLNSIAGLTTSANQMIYTTGSDTYAVTSLTAAGRNLIDDADASAQRTTLGLGTIATQNANNVDIDGGSIDATPVGATTPSTGKFTQADVDNIRVDGNTISSTNTNGNIILAPNGTGSTEFGSKNGFGTSTPTSPLSLASSFLQDGSSGSSFNVYIPITVLNVKNADSSTLNSASSNANNSLTLAAGTDISLAHVGIVRTESGTNAQRSTSPLRLAPTGYAVAVRPIIVGDAAVTGDGAANEVLMRQSIDNGANWVDWEFKTSYFHNFWSVRYLIVGPWSQLATTDVNVPPVFQLGVRTASAQNLRYTSI